MLEKSFSTLAVVVMTASFVHGEDWPHWRGPTRDGVQRRDRASDRMEPDPKRCLADSHARPERIDTHHLGRDDLSEHGRMRVSSFCGRSTVTMEL